MVMVTSFCPQFVPERGFRILSLVEAFSTILWTWGVKVRWGSNLNVPRVVWGNVLVDVECC